MRRPPDPTAVIVGGTGRLGRRIAAELVARGWAVVLASRAGTYDAAGGARIAAGVDVCHPQQLADLAARVSARGPLAGWVNAAAITGPVGASDAVTAAQWSQTLSVNLIGSAAGCAAAMRFAAPGASILNVSGGGAAGPRPWVGTYAASKAALVRYTETLAAEVAGAGRTGVRVNALAPGAFASRLWTTELIAVEGPEPAAAASEQVLARAAACAAWLLSADSRPLSGKLIAAQWDPWDTWRPCDLTALQDGDWLTLRRPVPGPIT